jgi:CubicO group peptidase (beta-lactamase class C family)
MTRVVFVGALTASAVLATPTAQVASVPDDPVAKYVEAQMQWRLVPGVAVAVTQSGRLIRAQGFGVADVERRTPVTADTGFHTGSIGKPFTAMAILDLVEDGRLTLDDSIVTFFDRAPPDWRSITIRHLLTHTSGLQNYVQVLPSTSSEYTNEELVRLVASQPLAFKPGTDQRYSNSGYLLLGFIVEKVTGVHLGDFLAREIFAPLAMTSTVMVGRHAPTKAPAARGYRLTDGVAQPIENPSRSLNSTGDGSLSSTVIDLAKWDVALNDDRLLRASSRQLMWSRATLNDGTTRGYGFGWILTAHQGHRIVEHGGTWQGFSGHVARYVSDRISVIVLTNLSNVGNTPGIIAHRIARYYIPSLKEAEWPSKAPIQVDTALLDRYTGEFRLGQMSLRTWREGSTLFVSAARRGRARLIPLSQTEFGMDVDQLRFRFARGPNGSVDLFVRDGNERRATRVK